MVATASLPLVRLTDGTETADALGRSFRETGFAVIEGHGIPPAVIERAEAAARAFFALPEAVKRRYHRPGGAGQRGYTPFGIETAKGADVHDLKEFWHVGRELPPGHPFAAVMAPNIWPAQVPGFRDAMRELYAALEAVALSALDAVGRHLGQAPGFFADAVRDGNTVLRLLHYLPVPAGAAGLRAGAHADINVLTLMLGVEEAGLELLSRRGEWLAIEVPPGALVLNVGDMLERQTGGDLPSTQHRVVNPSDARRHLPRYSMPFFLHYRPDWLIRPFRPDPAMPPITANDFLVQRLQEIRLA
jgi:isopenicillin N synthase-like dioxygenase